MESWRFAIPLQSFRANSTDDVEVQFGGLAATLIPESGGGSAMRALIRALLILVLLAAIGFLVLGFWNGSTFTRPSFGAPGAVGTSGAINTEKARERGAEIGEKAATAAAKVEAVAGDAALTTKIKAKMALDDSVRARAIDVSTNGTTVTLTGTVRSAAERDRAVALARETNGVTRVVDRLEIR
jgi:hyperosmotically inducible protein